MPADAQELIRALIDAQFIYPRTRSKAPPCRPVITLSRDYGAGGEEIARILAQRLGIGCFDREILDGIAQGAKVPKALMAQLDERVSGARDTWIHSLFTGQSVFPSSYRHHLVNVVLGIHAAGGIIIGRGAHVILATRPVFRVRIVGSAEACARRVAGRESLDPAQALERVRAINQERAEFLWNMFRHRLDDPTTFDLILNTDRLSDWDRAADLLLEAMECMGFDTCGGRTS